MRKTFKSERSVRLVSAVLIFRSAADKTNRIQVTRRMDSDG
jgi:hypothetical protein